MNKNLMKLFLPVACIFFIFGCSDTKYDLSSKTFYSTVNDFESSEASKVWFGQDGSFVITDVFYDGFHEIYGTYSVKGNVATLKVEKTGIGSFDKIVFEIKDEDSLMLQTALIGCRSGQMFSTNKSGTDSSKKVVSTFYNATQDLKDRSTITVYSDNTFEFTERFNNGEIKLTGKIVQDKTGVTLTDFSQFQNSAGEDVNVINFSIHNEKTWILKNDLRGSLTGHVFTTDGKIPAELVSGPKGDSLDDYAGTYIHAPMQDVKNEYLPKLVINSAGEFEFIENVYSGMGVYKGVIDIDGNIIKCQVKDASSMQGYTGENVKTIEFVKEGTTLVLKTDLCMSKNGDKFSLNK